MLSVFLQASGHPGGGWRHGNRHPTHLAVPGRTDHSYAPWGRHHHGRTFQVSPRPQSAPEDFIKWNGQEDMKGWVVFNLLVGCQTWIDLFCLQGDRKAFDPSGQSWSPPGPNPHFALQWNGEYQSSIYPKPCYIVLLWECIHFILFDIFETMSSINSLERFCEMSKSSLAAFRTWNTKQICNFESVPIAVINISNSTISECAHQSTSNLHLSHQSHKKAGTMWREAGLGWKEFLPEDEDVNKFVTEQVSSC